jgi:hypothetical protein
MITATPGVGSFLLSRRRAATARDHYCGVHMCRAFSADVIKAPTQTDEMLRPAEVRALPLDAGHAKAFNVQEPTEAA